nr:nicotinate phosphoribosyltransferase [Candidatus Korarchaeota archaeon]
MIEAPLYLDFYKTFHHKAYKPGVEEVYSNFTARQGKHSNIEGGSTSLVGGLQACIGKIIEEEWAKFFEAESADDAVALYEQVVSHGLGRSETAQHLRDLWELGYLPLEFKGLPEGLEVPYGIPHFTVRSTVKGFGWLTNMIETVLSAEIWPVHTAMTTANEYRKTFEEYAEKTGSPDFLVPFQGHDFSFRGMMGVEAAKLTGMGHMLAGFIGSDSVPAAIALQQYYGADLDPNKPCTVIASVPATEHSVQCSFNE